MTQTLRDTLVGFIIAGLSLMVFLLVGGGAPEPAPIGIEDAGQLVGWVTPFTKLVMDGSALIVVGLLLAATFLLPTAQPEVQGLSVRAVRLASSWAFVWAAATAFYFLPKAGEVFGKGILDLSYRE